MISFKNIIYINTQFTLTWKYFASEAGVQSSESENKLECAQCGAVQCSAIKCSVVQLSAVQCSAVQFSAV